MKKLKQYDYLLYTFIIGIIIIFSIYKLQDITPLGKNSLLTVDFYHQYGPMLAELYDRIYNGSNLIYSFNTGLGLPFFRNFFNYLSSPLNMLIFLFKRKNILMSYSIIIGLKSILSALTMNYYLTKKHNKKNYLFIGLSLLYAYQAYFTAYYWNIMWIDGLIYLPLITLGIERIINKNNGILYTISLSLMLYTNYFIGYMLCIYSCLYFICYLLIKIKFKNVRKNLNTIGKFIMSSLIAGLLMSFSLLPMYDALTSTNATVGSMPTSQYYAFNIYEFLGNHLTGIKSTVFASDISNCPNISSGILIITTLFLFYINKNISIKRKIIYSLLLIILFLSFYIAPLDYIWHAFHVPNDLPYRYSFIYTFIMITIASYVLNNIKNYSFIKIILSFIFTLIYITIFKLTNYKNITNNMLTINYLLITIYFLIYTLYHLYPKVKKTAVIIFIMVIGIECVISINHNWNIDQDINNFYKDYNSLTSSINNIKNKDTEKFYRIEKNYIQTLNDGAWYNYYSGTTFSSMAYQNIAKLVNELGMPGNNINSYYYKQNTPIFDLMFDIKYIIGEKEDINYYKEVQDNNKIYKSLYNSGLIFGVNKNIKKWQYNYINPFEYQNDFIENSTNIDNTLTRLTLKNKEIIFNNEDNTVVKFSYENNNNNIYLYSNNYLVEYILINDTLYYKKNTDINEISLLLNKDIKKYEQYDESYIINEFVNKDDIDIYISFSNYLNEEIDVYSLDKNKFINAYNIFNENKLNITNFKENIIEGNINLNDNKTIYTSIPYDKGWKVYVDNRQIKTFKINDSLLGFDLDKGNHEIKLKFIPNNLNIGITLSLTTLIFSITYLITKKTNRQSD